MTVPIAEFKKLELRIAKILDVEEIPGADRLWKLSIDVGAHRKHIVAGIKAHYSKEALVGKHIVVVDNLEPAVIRGVASEGMLLAAKDGDKLALVVPEKESPAGSSVG